jgi:hypothetical protein
LRGTDPDNRGNRGTMSPRVGGQLREHHVTKMPDAGVDSSFVLTANLHDCQRPPGAAKFAPVPSSTMRNSARRSALLASDANAAECTRTGPGSLHRHRARGVTVQPCAPLEK